MGAEVIGWHGTSRGAIAAATALTFGVALLFSYGPQAPKMVLPAALTVSLVAAGAALLSGYRPIMAVALATALTVLVPIIGANLRALDLVVVVVVFRASLLTEVRPWILTVVAFFDLSVNDAWQRFTFQLGWMEPSVLYPALLTVLAVGLGLQSRRVRIQHLELLALREADRQRAVSDERRRIARDLHDIAAHHLTALIVRNKVALRVNTPLLLKQFVVPSDTSADPRVTPRELDLIRLLARGMSNDEIAKNAFLSRATVKTHISNILTKLNLDSRIQIVVWAYERGLTEINGWARPKMPPEG